MKFNIAKGYTNSTLPKKKLEFNKLDMLKYITELNTELANLDKKVELLIYGGASICLAYEFRESTRDIDAIFDNDEYFIKACNIVSVKYNLEDRWLNNSILKCLLDITKEEFIDYLTLSNLHVQVVSPRYLLALKVKASRVGEAFHDYSDALALCKLLSINTKDGLLKLCSGFYLTKLLQYNQLKFIDRIVGDLNANIT